MENRLPLIIEEIEKKEGRAFLGLQANTEKQLNDLKWYLIHPKVQEKQHVAENLMDLYYRAKESDFLKMEEIKRKLDQLKVTIGEVDLNLKIIKPESVLKHQEKKQMEEILPNIENYDDAIQELANKIEDLLEGSIGKGLPVKTQNSLARFLEYLSHPDLLDKKDLFNQMFEKYLIVEKNSFMQMQAFDDMLSMISIKLGKPSKRERKIITKLEQRSGIQEELAKLEEEQQKLAVAWEEFKKEKEKLSKDTIKLLDEKLEFEKVRKQLEEDFTMLESEKAEIRIEKLHLKEQDELLQSKIQRFENLLKKMNDGEIDL